MKRFIFTVGFCILAISLIALQDNLFAGDTSSLYPHSEHSISGPAAGNIDLNGYYMYDSTKAAQIGGAAATGHSLGTGDTIISGALEVDGDMYIDGVLRNYTSFCNTDNLVWGVGSCAADGNKFQPHTTYDQLVLVTGSIHGNQWVVGSLANKDYDHADISQPAFYIQSATDPDSNNTQYMGFWHNTTDAYMQVGTGTLKFIDNSSNCLWKKEYHTSASAVDPGGSGPTLAVGGAGSATLYYVLDATSEYLYTTSDIHNDWDGVSDIVIEVHVALDGAEAANDIIQAEIIADYFGEHEDMDTSKTQTRSINHDIVNDNNAGDVHELIFLLDYDLASNVVETGDVMGLRFRLDSVAGGTDVAAVRFLTLNLIYRACTPQITMGTFPSEG